MERITDAEMAEMEKRCAAATAGPWHWHSCGEKCYSFVLGAGVSMTEGEILPPGRIETERYNEAEECYEQIAFINDYVAESGQQSGDRDFDFIAHARTDLPRLLAEVRRLNVIVERLPKTADGVVVVPELDALYHPGFKCEGDIERHGETEWCGLFYAGGEVHTYPASECYSTRVAAESAAQHAGEAKGGE